MMSKGFSLLELMFSIVVVGILVAVGVPAISDFTVRMRVDNEISDMRRVLLAARNSAVTSGFQTTICPLDESNECSNDWQSAVSVFTDIDGDRVYEAADNEMLIAVKNPSRDTDSFTYARNGITYLPDGTITGLGNGTFVYCPQGFDDFARGIIVSRTGRTRKTTDTDNDGIDEDNDGNAISAECPAS